MREVVQEVASVIITSLVPGVGPTVKVLEWILTVCKEVKECKESCVYTHNRLRMVLDEMDKMEADGTTPPSEAVKSFHKSLTLLWTDLAPYKNTVFFERLLRHKKLKATIATVNEELDSLCEILNIASTRAMMDWRLKWNHDVESQNEMLRKLLDGSRDAVDELVTLQSKVDMLMLLVAEKKTIGADDSGEVIQVIDRSIRTISTEARKQGGTGRTEAVPTWFVLETSVTYLPKPFATGAFGSVHTGKYLGGDVVVKLLLDGGLDQSAQEAFMREVTLWASFNFVHVVKMLGACHVSNRPFIISEKAPNGNLAEYLARGDSASKPMWELLRQVALGLNFLHEHDVVHGDLKLNNVLINGEGKALLADFGLSRVKHSSRSKMTTLASGKAVGGLRWMAPERFQKEPQFDSDVYALGMCIIEAATGDAPYGNVDDESVRELIKKGIRPDRPASLSDREWALVVKMTEKNHMDRILLKDVIAELEALANAESIRLEEQEPYCTACNASQRQGAKWCDICGQSLTGELRAEREQHLQSLATKHAPDADDVGSLLERMNGTSEHDKTPAVKMLYRRLEDKSTAREITTAGVGALLTLAKEITNFARSLYAFGCLKAVHSSTGTPNSGEMEIIRSRLDDKVASNSPEVNSLVTLLSAADVNQRDERQAAELVVLMLGLRETRDGQENPNQNALRSLIRPLASALAQVSGGVSDAVLFALESLTEHHSRNFEELYHASVVPSLMSVLASGSADAQHRALRFLAKLTSQASAAESCRTSQHIQPLVRLLEEDDDEVKANVLTVVANITKGDATMPRRLGSRGIVAVLVDLLSGTNARITNQAFKTLAVLCADASNGVMFKQAGGIQRLKQLLTNAAPDAIDGILLDMSTLLATDELRRSVAKDRELLRTCLSKFDTENPKVSTNAARVLGELVKSDVSVVQAIDNEKLLEKLARRVDEATGTARLNAFRTLLAALPPAEVATTPSARIA